MQDQLLNVRGADGASGGEEDIRMDRCGEDICGLGLSPEVRGSLLETDGQWGDSIMTPRYTGSFIF